MNRQEIELWMDELALAHEHAETYDKKIIEKLYELARGKRDWPATLRSLRKSKKDEEEVKLSVCPL